MKHDLMDEKEVKTILEQIRFDKNGLVPVITQDYNNDEILMMAWMNADSMTKTLTTGQAHYWSRSRKSLWRKGETSGHTQTLKELFIDCDGDTILIKIKQIGVACHTGEQSCFFRRVV